MPNTQFSANTEACANCARSTVRATTTAVLGNVAYWTGGKLTWESEPRRFKDAEANKYLLRPYRKPWDLVKIT